jgi:hypothetical protein
LNEVLRSRLLEMKALDERTRARLAETGELFAGYALAMVNHAQREREALVWAKRVGWL